MHNAHAIGNFVLVIATIIAIFINTFFVWLAMMIAGLRSGFGGKLMISAAGVVPLYVFPGFWGIIASIGLIAYLVRVVTDAEDWSGPLKFLGAQVLIGLVLIAIALKLVVGSLDFSKISELEHQDPSKFQSSTQERLAPSRQESSGESGEKKSDRNYGLSPEELAEVERQMKAPLDEFRKR